MDRTVSKVLAFEGDGKIVPIEGGYSDYLAWKERAVLREKEEKIAEKSEKKPVKAEKDENLPKSVKKLAYKEQKELDDLPKNIEAWEAEQEVIEAKFCDTDYFSNDPENFQKDQKRLDELEKSLAKAYTRWETLEAKQQSF